MQTMNRAMRAYETATTHRSLREQEADVFRRAIGALKAAQDGNAINRARALADNQRLWVAVNDLMRDPANQLPAEFRASVVSVGSAVRREMERAAPDFNFLISVNEDIAAGLSSI
ncbi:MAG: hypothetical protein JO227_09085 [Acetobacteraceae bacterium]|nr:hypothetical protein [Acetobacteraceae bacterium]